MKHFLHDIHQIRFILLINRKEIFFIMQTTFKDLNLLLSQEFSSNNFFFCDFYFVSVKYATKFVHGVKVGTGVCDGLWGKIRDRNCVR